MNNNYRDMIVTIRANQINYSFINLSTVVQVLLVDETT